MINDCVIMAGGSGTRLWPASTNAKPKQFLGLPSSKKSFFGDALERALAVIDQSSDGRAVIIAGKRHINLVIDECSRLDAHKRKRFTLIPEPQAKHTAPAIACAAMYINLVAGAERNILVQTSDHIIEPLEVFKADTQAAGLAAASDKLVVFGIHPTRPETGYGYIESDKVLTIPQTAKKSGYEPELYTVKSFREKPELETAKKFLASKKFYWNSGMFAFSARFILNEFERNAPEVIQPFRKLAAPGRKSYKTRKGLCILDDWEKIEDVYKKTKAISFEHSITEKCSSVAMVKAGFSWIDVGSWDEYAGLAKRNNCEVYSSNEEASRTCFVDSDIPVALCGVEDLIVIARTGADGSAPVILISKKGETQRVREIVDKVKAAGRTELL